MALWDCALTREAVHLVGETDGQLAVSRVPQGDSRMKASRAMDDRQFSALIRVAGQRRYHSAPRDKFLFYLIGKTGLRISEALSLRVRDLWLEGDLPFVRVRTLKLRGGPQTDEVLLEQHVARLARFYLARTLPNLTHREASPEDPLFPSCRRRRPGSSMTRRNALSLFRTYARLAQLPPELVLHSLRHYRATRLLRVTGDKNWVKEQMRHRSLKSLETYLHSDPETSKRYLQKLAEGEA